MFVKLLQSLGSSKLPGHSELRKNHQLYPFKVLKYQLSETHFNLERCFRFQHNLIVFVGKYSDCLSELVDARREHTSCADVLFVRACPKTAGGIKLKMVLETEERPGPIFHFSDRWSHQRCSFYPKYFFFGCISTLEVLLVYFLNHKMVQNKPEMWLQVWISKKFWIINFFNLIFREIRSLFCYCICLTSSLSPAVFGSKRPPRWGLGFDPRAAGGL